MYCKQDYKTTALDNQIIPQDITCDRFHFLQFLIFLEVEGAHIDHGLNFAWDDVIKLWAHQKAAFKL